MRSDSKYKPNKCDNTKANARRKKQIEKGQLKKENGLEDNNNGYKDI